MVGAILSGIGGLAGLLSSLGLGNRDVPYVNANPYTDKTFNQFQNDRQASNNRFNSLMGSAEGTASRMSGVQAQLQKLFGNMGSLHTPGKEEGFDLFKNRTQDLINLGKNAATEFSRPFKEKSSEIADRRAGQAAQQVMSTFGGAGYSGAAAGAASGAASDVFADYEKGMADMYGQIGSGITGQALSQERGLSENAPQQRFANLMNQLLQQANIQSTIGSSIGNQAGILGNLAGTQGQMSNALTNNIGMLSAPSYNEQITENPLAAFGQQLGGIGNMFSNPDFLGQFKGALPAPNPASYNPGLFSDSANPFASNYSYNYPSFDNYIQ